MKLAALLVACALAAPARADFRYAMGNDVFTELVITHHAGGVHMAEYAEQHAQTAAVRRWAASMADGQRGEIAELNRWRVKNGLGAVAVHF